MNERTILVTAYAVQPYKGSEDGMGWNMIVQIARFNRVIAITRKNNREAIEKYLAEENIPEAENMEFAYFDLPYFLRFWKKGGRGAMLYFYLWQLGVALWIRSKSWSFDIVHNLNFHNDWTPSFLWLCGKPLVWGPIGHHPLIPEEYLQNYDKKVRRGNRWRWRIKQYFWKLSPLLAITKRQARHVFAMNSSVAEQLKLSLKKTSILPSVGCEAPYVDEDFIEGTGFTVLSVGRFVALKGFDLTIAAFAHFYHQLPDKLQRRAQLVLVGKGPELANMRQWIAEYQLENAVKIIPWMERKELRKMYRDSQVLLFPSHEGAGMVVAEALSYGLPVVCLDNCGPGEFVNANCGLKAPYSDYDTTVEMLGEHLSNLFLKPHLRQKLRNGAFRQYRTRFRWSIKGLVFREVYESLLESSTPAIAPKSVESNTL